MGMADWVTCCALSLWQTFGGHEAALLGWATPPLDDQPCTWCGQDYDSPTMILWRLVQPLLPQRLHCLVQQHAIA